MNPGDQGMLGVAVDPQYGAGHDFVYIQYVLDEIPGENDPPHWNDTGPVARQLGGNPCQDPPYPDEPTPANSEGGALRTMDLLTSVGGEANDPVWYNGVVLRIDPDTGEAAAGNPLTSVGVAGDDLIIAHGFATPTAWTSGPGPNGLNNCDAYDVDFSILRTG